MSQFTDQQRLGVSGRVVADCLDAGRPALVGYLPVGYPSVADSLDAVRRSPYFPQHETTGFRVWLQSTRANLVDTAAQAEGAATLDEHEAIGLLDQKAQRRDCGFELEPLPENRIPRVTAVLLHRKRPKRLGTAFELITGIFRCGAAGSTGRHGARATTPNRRRGSLASSEQRARCQNGSP